MRKSHKASTPRNPIILVGRKRSLHRYFDSMVLTVAKLTAATQHAGHTRPDGNISCRFLLDKFQNSCQPSEIKQVAGPGKLYLSKWFSKILVPSCYTGTTNDGTTRYSVSEMWTHSASGGVYVEGAPKVFACNTTLANRNKCGLAEYQKNYKR